MLAEVTADCLHPSGRWQRAPGDERIDAALLLPALRGATPAADPRALATLKAAEAELARDGYMYRSRRTNAPSGGRSTYLCADSPWRWPCTTHGREAKAARWFERNRAACVPPGLLTEEYDVAQRQVRRNAPQAFVHALLLERPALALPGRRP